MKRHADTRQPMTYDHRPIILIVLTILGWTACAKVTHDQMTVLARAQEVVRASDNLGQRIPSFKVGTLPVGDVIKQWRWDQPWAVRNEAGEVIRHMYAPDGPPPPSRSEGPQLTVIHDPQRGTIYETYFVQRTERLFDLPVRLHFYASRDAATPLFSLSFIDAAIPRCQQSRVSRGGIQSPGVTRALLESAEWVAVEWTSVPYEAC
jgi:hypothetical protein